MVFTDIFDSWVRSIGYDPVGKLSDTYSIEGWLGIDHEKASSLVDTFNHSETMRNQPAMECALQIIPKLYALGYRFVAITACGNDDEFRMRRHHTLETVFGISWDDVLTVGYGMGKGEHLEKYDGAIWVEDNLKHAIVGAEMGHRTFLLDRQHNRVENDLHGITRVQDWHEIFEHLEGEK